MKGKKMMALILIVLPLLSATGCRGKFLIAGVRKLFIRPKIHRKIDKKLLDTYAKNVSPRVKVRSGASQEGQDNGEAVASELAARYRELAVSKPFDPIVRYNLGKVYLREGLLDQALYEFDMAASLDPQFASAYLMLGRALRLQGQYDLAIAKLAIASRLQPELAFPYIEAGICWDRRGFHDKARRQYEAALAVSPDNLDAYNNMGYSHFLEGNYKKAIEQYRKALRVAPDDRYANNNIALAYGLRGKFKRAFAHFSRALAPSAAHNNVGYMLLRAGKLDASIEHLQAAIQIDPTSGRALGNLTVALQAVGRYDEAERVRQQLLMVQKNLVAGADAEATGLYQ